MSVSLITISHGRTGEALLETATSILGTPSPRARHFPFAPSDDPDDLASGLAEAMGELDDGSGILVLADLYGASPCNLARREGSGRRVRIVTGMNLPMILRVLNYAGVDLETMARLAREGGRDGIIECSPLSESRVDRH